ncbi:uncharacterized protein F5891DRAFT_1195207 [Suillus fuscotomentosus]|uniref:Uncharacterized protein n=1 Tax=Suillus fuscotomentosus TaxID=1912939 RepID=A0AAD4HFE5_9AGAM|nr:uncharacterized protein F5891DRAFT_1195207 [Suillus fuscotomentosus]KAG1894507.1 hypothetical protein F5891DRAFT_1195207 [Suillus fuscotomentosus]
MSTYIAAWSLSGNDTWSTDELADTHAKLAKQHALCEKLEMDLLALNINSGSGPREEGTYLPMEGLLLNGHHLFRLAALACLTHHAALCSASLVTSLTVCSCLVSRYLSSPPSLYALASSLCLLVITISRFRASLTAAYCHLCRAVPSPSLSVM